MSKGPEQTGTQTVTTQDPRAQYQTPYLQSGWESANDIWRGTQLNPQGYNSYWSAAAGPVTDTGNAAAAPFYAGTSGAYSGANSPAYGGYSQVAAGTTPGQQAAATSQGALYNSTAGTGAALADPLAQAQKESSGYYLNSNPYLDAMYKSASDATTSAYQTATAPRTAGSYELAGRYGSPSAQNAVTQNEQTLGRTLGNLSADIYGKDYAAERGLQNQATTDYGKMVTGGLGLEQAGYYNAGNLGLSGTQAQTTGLSGLQSGYNTGNQAAMDAAKLLPTIQSGYLAGPGGEVSSIAGLQAQQWDPLQQYMKLITMPPGYQASTSTQPIYGSSAGQTLGGIGSALSGIGSIARLFPSDRRLKEDTRVVGHVGRLPVHTFNYKGDSTRRVGFMADEVEKVDPGAVVTTNLGFKVVDYGRALGSALAGK